MLVRNTLRVCFLLFVVALISCKTIKTQPPQASYEPVVIKPQVSTISIPLEVQTKKLEGIVNSYLNGVLYEDTNLDDDDLMLKVTKANTITLDAIGENFKYKVPLKIWVKAGFKVQKFGFSVSDYEETNCELILEFVSKIKMNPDWSATSTTNLSAYEWVVKPSLDYGLVKIPLTYIADKIIESQKLKLIPLLDQQAAKYLQLKDYISQAWIKLQEPISLSSSPSSWLVIEPLEMTMSPLMGRAGLVQSTVGVKTYLKYKMGTKPDVKIKALPALVLSRDEIGSFTLSLQAALDYSIAENIAKKYLEGQEFEFSNGKKKVKVEEVTLYGKDGRLIIGSKLSGSVKGTIYLNGIPFYDPTDKSVKVKDLNFDVDTKNKLIKSADWLAHNAFLKRMQGYLVFPIKNEIKEAESLLQKNLSSNKINEYITLNGSVIQILPEDIYLTPEGIFAVLISKGRISVTIMPE